MTQIIISDLQSDDLDSLPLLLKDGQKELIDISIKRSLDARKISGGAVGTKLRPPAIGLIYVDPKISEI
jgi:hypothetical protein